MIGKVPLDQLAKERNLIVEWKAFELKPEGVEIPALTPEKTAQYKTVLEGLSKRYGVPMVWNDKSKHSRRALEGSKFAEEQGLGDEYHNALFAAQFQQDKDIDDMEILVSIAEEIGLDPIAFREVLVSRKYQQAVLNDCDEAHMLGVHSIPCFIVENRALFGAQGYEALKRLLDGEESVKDPFAL